MTIVTATARSREAQAAKQKAKQKRLETEGRQMGTVKRLVQKVGLPAAEVAAGAYGLPATLLRTNPSLDPAVLEATLGGYGRSVDTVQAALSEARTKNNALPAAASLLERGANVAADVVGNLVPIVVGAPVAGPSAAAGGAGFLQTLGQGGTPTEAVKEAAFSATGAAAGAGAEKLARAAAPRLASSKLGQAVAGRTITGTAGAVAGLTEADLRDFNEQQTATTSATNAVLGAFFYGGKPKTSKSQLRTGAERAVDAASAPESAPPRPRAGAEAESHAPLAELRSQFGALHQRLNEPDARRAEIHEQLDAIETEARRRVNERLPNAQPEVREQELQRQLLAGQDADTVIGAARRKAEQAGREVDGAEWRETEQRLRSLLVETDRQGARVAELEAQLKQFGAVPPAPARRAEWRQWWETKETEARARLQQRLAPNVTHDITDIAGALPDLAVIGSAKMAKGALRFADWSAAMLQDYGEDIRPHLRTIFDEAAKLQQQAQPANRAALQRQLTAARQAQETLQIRLAQRLTRLDRTTKLETLSALRKAGLLTGVKTHLRNLGGNTVFQAAEELARIPASIADLAVAAVTKQRTISGADPWAVAKGARAAATRGVREAWETILAGAPVTQQVRQQLREVRSGSRVLDTYVNGVFRTLSAEDRIFKTYAYARALEDRARVQALSEARQRKLPRHQVAERTRQLIAQPTEALAAEAIGDAEIATFNNPNRAAQALQAGREKLGPGGRFALDLVIPFSNTPSNIIARTLEYAGLGYGRNVSQLAKAIANRAFTPDEQRAFAQTFGRATTGSAGLITLGWKLAAAGMMTGLSSTDTRDRERDKATGRPPMAVLIHERWYQVGAFAPVGTLLGLGASLYEASHGQAQKPAEELAGTAGKVLLEQPMLRGTKEITDALSAPGRLPDKAGRVAGSFVPTIVSDAGAALDTVQRQPRGFGQQVQARVPLWRAQLPARADAFGQPLETRRTDFFDPFLTRPAREAENPLAGALTRLGVGITPPQKRRSEQPQAYEERRLEVGQLFNRYGAELLDSSEWQRATDEERKAALAYLLTEAKQQSGHALRAERLRPSALLESGRKRLSQEVRRVE